jgi:hypothetical protein
MGLWAGFTAKALGACQGPVKVDDFSKWSSNTNNLGEWTSGRAATIERLVISY